ncbi:MAG TPA: CHRD domain-containing protein [Thermoanaerobaculia bacterium]|nr:CHRD domain-containing protein [Thermoanaerobaculia bacterium]
MRSRNAFLLLVLALCTFTASAQSSTFNVTLLGSNEVPPADPDGTGTATVVIIGTSVNYTITVNNVTAPPIAQHIHQGAAGVNGPIVINLVPFVGSSWVCAPGPSSPCTLTGGTTTTPALANAIIANPAGFYLNVHTTDFPGGAIRGQLVAAPEAPTASTLGLVVLGAVLALAGMFFVRRA